MIVAGQVLWKVGIEKKSDAIDLGTVLSPYIFKIIFSPYILLGVLSYGLATLSYMLLLSRYDYTDLQTVVVSSSLITTFITASLFFDENINPYNLVGIAFLLCGVLFITKF